MLFQKHFKFIKDKILLLKVNNKTINKSKIKNV